jgi:hypothetical protein
VTTTGRSQRRRQVSWIQQPSTEIHDDVRQPRTEAPQRKVGTLRDNNSAGHLFDRVLSVRAIKSGVTAQWFGTVPSVVVGVSGLWQ